MIIFFCYANKQLMGLTLMIKDTILKNRMKHVLKNSITYHHHILKLNV